MKLYTEFDVREMLELTNLNVKFYIDTMTPIELPNHKEIEEASDSAWSDYEYEEGNLYSTTFKGGWNLAIKWVIDKIKNNS